MKSTEKVISVAINGAAGRIAYSLIPLLCNGLVFGPDVKISLRLLEIPAQESALHGTMMELEDCSYPLLKDVKYYLNNQDGYRGADVAILIATHPHYPGMERRDLLAKNGKMFEEIGDALNNGASKNCKIVCVANPVNSLTTILAHSAKNIPKQNFSGLSRLDYNRAKWLISQRCNTTVDKIKDLVVWGNHSDTQYPDTFHVKIDGKPIKEFLGFDENWLHTTYVETISNRWKRIVDTRGTTSILSPASAVKDHLRDWYRGTEEGDYVSMGVFSGGKYGVPDNICFSLPVETKNFEYKIVDFDIDQFTKDKINKSVEEIMKELDSIGFKI